MNSNFVRAKYEVTSAIIKRKDEKMKKLTDLFHVEQKRAKAFRPKQYGDPTGEDIACAIVGVVFLVCLIGMLLNFPQ